MTWAYLIAFNHDLGSRESVQNLLDEMPEVTHWYSCLPNCVFFTSTLCAGDIADRVLKKFGNDHNNRFLITEVHEDRQGWLPKAAWHIFSHPEHPRLKQDAEA